LIKENDTVNAPTNNELFHENFSWNGWGR